MIENLRLFVKIVECGGMAAAGRELGWSPATVSARLAALEDHYGVRLLQRTTRSSSLTSEGAELLEGARRILAEVDALDGRVRRGGTHLSGTIRITAPLDIGRNWLVPLLDRFVDAHPELGFELSLTDGYVDLVGAGFDLALRYGVLHDSTLRTRKLCEARRVVCAAPSYLERCGAPAAPGELASHNCLLMRFGDGPDHRWSFVVDGKPLRVAVRGNRIANDSDLVRRWCVAGYGVARKATADIGRDLAAGRLVRLLRAFEAEPTELQVVYPGGRPLSRRVRALLDWIVEEAPTLEHAATA